MRLVQLVVALARWRIEAGIRLVHFTSSRCDCMQGFLAERRVCIMEDGVELSWLKLSNFCLVGHEYGLLGNVREVEVLALCYVSNFLHLFYHVSIW